MMMMMMIIIIIITINYAIVAVSDCSGSDATRRVSSIFPAKSHPDVPPPCPKCPVHPPNHQSPITNHHSSFFASSSHHTLINSFGCSSFTLCLVSCSLRDVLFTVSAKRNGMGMDLMPCPCDPVTTPHRALSSPETQRSWLSILPFRRTDPPLSSLRVLHSSPNPLPLMHLLLCTSNQTPQPVLPDKVDPALAGPLQALVAGLCCILLHAAAKWSQKRTSCMRTFGQSQGFTLETPPFAPPP